MRIPEIPLRGFGTEGRDNLTRRSLGHTFFSLDEPSAAPRLASIALEQSEREMPPAINDTNDLDAAHRASVRIWEHLIQNQVVRLDEHPCMGPNVGSANPQTWLRPKQFDLGFDALENQLGSG